MKRIRRMLMRSDLYEDMHESRASLAPDLPECPDCGRPLHPKARSCRCGWDAPDLNERDNPLAERRG